MTPYPATFPVSDVVLILGDIRGNALVTDRVLFAKAVWELTGFGLLSSLGEPGTVLSLKMPTAMSLSDTEVANHLADFLTHMNKGIDPTSIMGLVPWSSVVQWGLKTLLAKV